MPPGTLSLPKHQSARVPPNGEKKLLIPRANRNSSWGFPRVKCCARGPGTQQVKNLHRVFQSLWSLLLFSPLVSEKTDVSYFQRNLRREASHLSSSTLQSQTRLLCYFQPQNHWFAPLLLSPRLPHTRVDMQRFAFLCPKHVFPLWLSSTARLQRANLRPCQELHLHKWLCHAPGPGWVKRGRNPQHTHVHLSCSSLTGIIPCHP